MNTNAMEIEINPVYLEDHVFKEFLEKLIPKDIFKTPVIDLYEVTKTIEKCDTQKEIRTYAENILNQYNLEFWLFQFFYLLAFNHKQTNRLTEILTRCKIEHMIKLQNDVENVWINYPLLKKTVL